MISPINIRTINISPNQVDLRNTDFHVPSFDPLDPLIASIEQVGTLHPPVVKETSSHCFIPVLGRRRLEALSSLKWDHFEVRIINPAQPDNETLIMVFWDNLERIKTDVAVRAYMVKRLMELIPIEMLAKKIFPYIDAPSKGPKLEKLSKIGGLERPILGALSNGRIQEKSAAILSELPDNQRLTLLRLVYDLDLNANKAFEIISNLFDLSIYRREPVTDFLARPEAFEILNNQNLTTQEKTSQFRNLIRRWVFPELTQNRDVFDKWVQQVSPPRNVTLRHAQSFEDDSVTIEIRLDSRSKAKDFLALTRVFQSVGPDEKS